MKKEWLNPELMNLSTNETNEETSCPKVEENTTKTPGDIWVPGDGILFGCTYYVSNTDHRCTNPRHPGQTSWYWPCKKYVEDVKES